MYDRAEVVKEAVSRDPLTEIWCISEAACMAGLTTVVHDVALEQRSFYQLM